MIHSVCIHHDTEQFANGIDDTEGYQYVSSTTSEADNTVITAEV